MTNWAVQEGHVGHSVGEDCARLFVYERACCVCFCHVVWHVDWPWSMTRPSDRTTVGPLHGCGSMPTPPPLPCDPIIQSSVVAACLCLRLYQSCSHLHDTRRSFACFATELYNDFLPYEKPQSYIHPMAVSIKPS